MRFLLIFTAVAALAQQPTTRILVAYHSVTGNTAKLAQSVQAGAASVDGVEATLRSIDDVTDDDITNSDGLLLGTPVHWWNISGEAKMFLDRVGAVLYLNDGHPPADNFRTGGAFCTGGGRASGKDLARMSILTAFLGMNFIPLGIGPEATGGGGANGASLTKSDLDGAQAYGKSFALMTRQIRAAAAMAKAAGAGMEKEPKRLW